MPLANEAYLVYVNQVMCLYVEKIGVCLVTDRTNKRYRNRVDIAMQRDEYRKARRFGRQKLTVKIIDISQGSH